MGSGDHHPLRGNIREPAVLTYEEFAKEEHLQGDAPSLTGGGGNRIEQPTAEDAGAEAGGDDAEEVGLPFWGSQLF